MSAYRRCPPTGGVCLKVVSVSGGSTVYSSVDDVMIKLGDDDDKARHQR